MTAPISQATPHSRSRKWPLAVTLAVVLSAWPISPAAAAEEDPAAAADNSASEADGQREAGPGESVGGVEVVRYAGSDPYEQSIKVAQAQVDAAGGTSEWVVLASGDSWANAEAAGPLAASLNAPVVLVPSGGLQTATARPDLVEFLRSTGVRRVVVVGNPEVLPNHEPSVLFGLGILPRNIERVHDDDAVGTSVAVARRIGTPAELGELGRTVIIASDQSVADAVAIGPLAAAGPLPLLLTTPDVLDPRIATYLTDLQIEHVVLVGGTAAIPPAVQAAIETAGVTVTRLAGRDRSDTARLAAGLFEQRTANDPDCDDGTFRIGLVPVSQPEQALTAGPLLAAQCAALRYAESDWLPADVHNTLFLAQHGPAVAHIVAFADDQMISDGLLRPSAPPVRVAAWQRVDDSLSGDPEVMLVVFDERGNQNSIPSTRMVLPSHRTRWISSEGVNWFGLSDRLTWAPDGARIAYSHATDDVLRVLYMKTGEETRPRFGAYVPRLFGLGVEWSRDSSQLLFDAFIDDESTVSEFWTELPGGPWPGAEIFHFDVATESVTRLTSNDVTESAVQWSPDGKRFSFSSSDTPFGFGNPFQRLVGLKTYDVDSGSSYLIDPSFGSLAGIHAHWSRDGTRIAFGATTNNEPSAWFQTELFIADHDGANLEQLTPTICPECFADRVEQSEDDFPLPFSTFPVSWSPDDERIAYYSDGSLQIYDFRTEKGHVLLPRWSYRSGLPDALNSEVVGWSPDGTILYVQLSGADCQVVAFDVAGQATEAPTQRPVAASGDSSWCGFWTVISPDSSHFAEVHPQTGLRRFGIAQGQWQQILSDWTTTDPALQNQLRGCSVEWTAGGILARCDYLQPPDEDE